MPGQTVSKLFGTLFVVIDALLFVYYVFFDIVFYLLSEPLGVDFDLPKRPSHPQTRGFPDRKLYILEKSAFSICVFGALIEVVTGHCRNGLNRAGGHFGGLFCFPLFFRREHGAS